jgi:hypothetical protein
MVPLGFPRNSCWKKGSEWKYSSGNVISKIYFPGGHKGDFLRGLYFIACISTESLFFLATNSQWIMVPLGSPGNNC